MGNWGRDKFWTMREEDRNFSKSGTSETSAVPNQHTSHFCPFSLMALHSAELYLINFVSTSLLSLQLFYLHLWTKVIDLGTALPVGPSTGKPKRDRHSGTSSQNKAVSLAFWAIEKDPEVLGVGPWAVLFTPVLFPCLLPYTITSLPVGLMLYSVDWRMFWAEMN